MKKTVSLVVLFLLVTSLLVIAEEETSEKSSCSGFWGSISCFLWGNPENRAGRGWFERGNVVGEATEIDSYSSEVHIICNEYNGCVYEITGSQVEFANLNNVQQTAVAEILEANNYDPQSGDYVGSPPASSPAPLLPAPAPAATPAAPAPPPTQPVRIEQGWVLSNEMMNCVVNTGCRLGNQQFNFGADIPVSNYNQLLSPAPAPATSSPPASPVPSSNPPAAPVPATAPAAPPAAVSAPASAPAPTTPISGYTYTGRVDAQGNPIIQDSAGINYFTHEDGFPFLDTGQFAIDTFFNAPIGKYSKGTPAQIMVQRTSYNDALGNPLVLIQGRYYFTSGDQIDLQSPISAQDLQTLGILEAPVASAATPPAAITIPPPPTPPPPGPPQGSQKIEGTDYSLGPDGFFYANDGKKVNPHELLQQQRITHDQAYNMLDAGARQSESNVLRDLPGGTQVNYQGNTYRYNSQLRGWQTADGKAAPAGLSSAVVQGQAQVTQPTILAGLPSNNFKIGDQQYTYGPDNQWHTGGAGGTIISAADLEKKLLASGTSGSGAPSYLPPGVTGNDELQQRITALKSQKDQIEKAKKARQEADSQMWAGSWFEGIQTSRGYQNIKQYASTAGDIASVMASGGKYQALSNALFGRETSRTWFLNADSEFFTTWANLPSYAATHGPLAPEACELDDARRTEIPGSSSQFVQTAGGSYQFVGAIQAEKTATTQPILCKRNEDPEMEAEFACRTGQVCVEDEFCHADADSDKEPDSEQPAQGYFYKITWGVAAPFDESFTPYIDEDNKAVKFNIQLIAEDGTSIWLYNRAGITGTGVIALENGASDRDVKTHFSSRVFDKACIRYDPQYTIKDRDGTEVEDQCVDIIVRNSGSVEFGSSRRTQSVTTASSEVSSNTDW